MIGGVLTALGLPLLVKALGGALQRLDHPLARQAADALAGVEKGFAEGVFPSQQLADSHRHLETMAALETEAAQTALRQVNTTFRREIISQDAFVRRWRPAFGYAVALTWVVQMVGLTYAMVSRPETAGAIIAAMGNLSMIWGVALSVLGVAVHQRSRDKAVAAGRMVTGLPWLSQLVETSGSFHGDKREKP